MSDLCEARAHFVDAFGGRAFDVFLKCFEKGVLIRTSGDIIALSPPLIISKQQIDELVGTVADALRASAP